MPFSIGAICVVQLTTTGAKHACHNHQTDGSADRKKREVRRHQRSLWQHGEDGFENYKREDHDQQHDPLQKLHCRAAVVLVDVPHPKPKRKKMPTMSASTIARTIALSLF